MGGCGLGGWLDGLEVGVGVGRTCVVEGTSAEIRKLLRVVMRRFSSASPVMKSDPEGVEKQEETRFRASPITGPPAPQFDSEPTCKRGERVAV